MDSPQIYAQSNTKLNGVPSKPKHTLIVKGIISNKHFHPKKKNTSIPSKFTSTNPQKGKSLITQLFHISETETHKL